MIQKYNFDENKALVQQNKFIKWNKHYINFKQIKVCNT